jgi:hypothetical protein
MNPARVLLAVLAWAFRLAPLPAFLFSSWVVLSEAVAGMPFHRAMVWGLWGLTAALLATYSTLWLIEKCLEWTAEYREAKRIAGLLGEAHAAGHRWVTVSALVNIWLDVQPENAAVRFVMKNYRLRTLKDAIEQGLLRADLLGDSFPSHRSRVEIASAIQFFRNRRWHDVKPRQAGEVYSDDRERVE